MQWEIDLVRHLFRRGAPQSKRRLVEPSLDWGICHMDLTIDNVHLAGNLTVFDFDSAGTSWRAVEPWGVLRSSATYFQAWLDGYRTARAFGKLDEAAVAVFGIVGDLRVVAWKLGWPNRRAVPRGSALRICQPLLTAGLTGKSPSSLQLRANSNFSARKPAARPTFLRTGQYSSGGPVA
ncbi:MAG TPA: phosphotransferase [Propionibacteriaceae bacterium]